MPYVQKFSRKTRVYMTEWHVGYARLYQSIGKMLKGERRRRAGLRGRGDNG